MQVLMEQEFFHWITSRALRFLIEDGELLASTEGGIKVIRRPSYRYYRRAANRLVTLVGQFSDPLVTRAIGERLEVLTLDAFSAHRFVRAGRGSRQFKGREWTKTAHDMDFIFERDGRGIGIECKNTLSYMDEKELGTKLDLCEYLGIRAVFVVRMMPKIWIQEVARRGGFTLVLSWWLFPPVLRGLADTIKSELGYPVDTPRALQEGTMVRFMKWWDRL